MSSSSDEGVTAVMTRRNKSGKPAKAKSKGAGGTTASFAAPAGGLPAPAPAPASWSGGDGPLSADPNVEVLSTTLKPLLAQLTGGAATGTKLQVLGISAEDGESTAKVITVRVAQPDGKELEFKVNVIVGEGSGASVSAGGAGAPRTIATSAALQGVKIPKALLAINKWSLGDYMPKLESKPPVPGQKPKSVVPEGCTVV